jgi:hypothetical protein
MQENKPVPCRPLMSRIVRLAAVASAPDYSTLQTCIRQLLFGIFRVFKFPRNNTEHIWRNDDRRLRDVSYAQYAGFGKHISGTRMNECFPSMHYDNAHPGTSRPSDLRQPTPDRCGSANAWL